MRCFFILIPLPQWGRGQGEGERVFADGPS